MKHFFSISVVIATYNSQRTIAQSLASVRAQKYPQSQIEIILVDGGSMDRTREIARMYNARWIAVNSKKQSAEYNKGIGVQKARGEILFLLDHDNVIPHVHWLTKMIKPFLDNPAVVGVETLRYHYDPKGKLLDRYFALFGAGDPLAFYLGKADRLSYLYNEYNLFGSTIDRGDYYLVRFSPNQIPTLGANGFLIRRQILIKHANIRPDAFFHIDVNVDLIRNGYNVYAFVKETIIHLTGYNNILNFLKRRLRFMRQFYLQTYHARRYSVYEPKDFFGLVRFVFYSVTFVKPTYDAFRGFLKIRDIAWFLHPVLSFVLVLIYSYAMIISIIKKRLS